MLNWISAIGAGIAFLALIALIWYASISKGQLNGILETNKISRATLEMSQRAYLFAETPIFIRQQPKVAIGINNLGHTPATKVKVYVHEARFKETGGVPNVIHSKSYEFGGDMTQIPSENGRYGVTILLEDLGENEISEIITGHEQLQIGITIEYYSGFHDDKPGFCYRYASFNAGAWDACPVYDFARLPK